VGARVDKFKVGDHVGIGNMVDSCLECRSCLSGEEQGCAKQVLTYNAKDWSGRASQGGGALYTAGGYSTAMVVHERFCILIPPSYPLEHAGPIMCAGTTMYDPMKRAGVQAGTEVGILGLGGLGVMGIKLAKVLGCTVTAISRGDAKRALAMNAGADHYINSKDADQMSAHIGRLSLIINTIPSTHDASIYNPLLSSDGKHIHAGLHSAAFAAGAANFLLPGRTQERTTFIGSVASTQEVMDLCASAGIQTEIELRPVADLNRIFELLDGANESGKRFVIDIAGTLASDVSTSPVPRLAPSPLPSGLLRELAEAIARKLSDLMDAERQEEMGPQTHAGTLGELLP
jgi:D-arabinose 1-dehydrogenase-like Zn-dependent alcohol dehydrogenase